MSFRYFEVPFFTYRFGASSFELCKVLSVRMLLLYFRVCSVYSRIRLATLNCSLARGSRVAPGITLTEWEGIRGLSLISSETAVLSSKKGDTPLFSLIRAC